MAELIEQIVKKELEVLGYTVLKRGWPDFLAYKGRKVRFIEVKTYRDQLSSHQLELHRALKLIGIQVEIDRRILDGRKDVKPIRCSSCGGNQTYIRYGKGDVVCQGCGEIKKFKKKRRLT